MSARAHVAVAGSIALAALVAITTTSACSQEGTALPSKDAGGAASDSAAATGEAGALAEQGRAFVLARNCAKCHQDDSDDVLSGSATARQTGVYAKNLTPDPDTGIDGWTDAQYVKAILDGLDDQGQSLCPPMPHARDDGMTEAEALAIAAYLRALPPVHHLVPESTCPPIKPRPDAGADASPPHDAGAPADAADGG